MRDMSADPYDIVLVGSGFASCMFLHEALKFARKDARILVLERGPLRPHWWQIENRGATRTKAADSIHNETPAKPWTFALAVGGGSNCWRASTPRMLPEDFEIHSRYGVGADWPVRYAELEPHYCDAERLMGVAGSTSDTPFPRSQPYPLGPHAFSSVDRLMKRRHPDAYFTQPCARPTAPLASGRPACCGAGRCELCPIDSKFSILNEMRGLFEDRRVKLMTDTEVTEIETKSNRATGVRAHRGGREKRFDADLVGLGANAIFNPYLLLRSGLSAPGLGRGLVEQVSKTVQVDLDGLDNRLGSTSITGHGYMFYAGDHRRERAGALIESHSIPSIRHERGRWLQRAVFKFSYEDLRQDSNRVFIDPSKPDRPSVRYEGPSSYTQRAIDRLETDLEEALGALPVDGIEVSDRPDDTGARLIGTTVMGDDPGASVVDGALVHHRIRNLVVLGSGVFPTASPADPTLTLGALAAHHPPHLDRHVVVGGRIAVRDRRSSLPPLSRAEGVPPVPVRRSGGAIDPRALPVPHHRRQRAAALPPRVPACDRLLVSRERERRSPPSRHVPDVHGLLHRGSGRIADHSLHDALRHRH
jgi:choline dehydrogenase-like flavoprotein